MKPILFFLLAGALVFPAAVQADVRQDIKRMNLTEQQMQQISETVAKTRPELEKAKAELKVVQAQLARLLLEDTPARAEIEKLVRQAQEWEFKIKMLKIDQSLRLRTLLGKDRWAGLSALARRGMEAEKSGKPAFKTKEEDRPALKSLLKTLKDLN